MKKLLTLNKCEIIPNLYLVLYDQGYDTVLPTKYQQLSILHNSQWSVTDVSVNLGSNLQE